MDFLKQNWPLLLITVFFVYRKYQSYRIRKLLPALKQAGAQVIDVRSENEYLNSHAPGSMNIPLQNLSAELSKLSKEKPIVVCCASGTRSAMARKILQRNGFKKTYNIGSWRSLPG